MRVKACHLQRGTFSFKAGKLDDPSITRSEALEGMNLITWNPVVNAQGYDVYRYDPDQKVTKKLNPQLITTDLYVTDWVSWDNQLQDGKKYDYTIVAVSSESTSQSGIGASLPVQNGSKKVTIQAKIPATFTPTAPTVGYEELYDGTVLVKVSDTKPNLKYKIAYTFGQASIVRSLTAWDNAHDPAGADWYNPVKTVRFLPLGGDNTILAQAQFIGGNDYYTSGTAEAIVAASGLTGGLSVIGFSASRDGTESKVKFQWSATSVGDTFEIYKAEIDKELWNGGAEGTPWTSGPGSVTINVKSDWAPVTLSKAAAIEGTLYKAEETVTSIIGSYIYGIVAKGGGYTSAPKFATIDKAQVHAPSITVAHKAGSDDEYALVTWNVSGGGATAGVSYTLGYATVDDYDKTDPDPDNWTWDNEGALTPITLTAADYLEGRGVKEQQLAAGKKYIFRLTVTKGGATDTAIDFITGPGAITFSGFAKVAAGNNQYGANAAATSVTLTLVSSKKADDAYDIELYRRVNTTATTDETAFVQLASIPKFAKDATSWFFTDTGLTVGATYQYKIRVVGNGHEDVINVIPYGNVYDLTTIITSTFVQANFATGAVPITGTGVSPALQLPAWSGIISTGSAVVDSANPSSNSYTGSNIVGLTLNVRYKSTATAPNDVKPHTLTVASVTGSIPPTGTGTVTTTEYYYYISVPTDAAAVGSGLVEYQTSAGTWATLFTY